MPLFLLVPCHFSFCFVEFLAHAFLSEAERRSRGNNRGRACAHYKTAHCHGKAADFFVILVSCFPASSRLSNLIIMFVFPVYSFFRLLVWWWHILLCCTSWNKRTEKGFGQIVQFTLKRKMLWIHHITPYILIKSNSACKMPFFALLSSNLNLLRAREYEVVLVRVKFSPLKDEEAGLDTR